MPFVIESRFSNTLFACALVAALLSGGCTAQKKANTASDIIGGTSEAHEDKAKDSFRYLLAAPVSGSSADKSRCWFSIETPSKVDSSEELWSILRDLDNAGPQDKATADDSSGIKVTQLTQTAVKDETVQTKIREILKSSASNQASAAAATGAVGAGMALGAVLAVVPPVGVAYALVGLGASYLMERESSDTAKRADRFPEMFLQVRHAEDDMADSDTFGENDFLSTVARALTEAGKTSQGAKAQQPSKCDALPK
jgi:hypothetical protein